MIDAGVRMTAGSDSSWGWYAPGEFVHEIHMLAEAGLSSHDAIVAGTAGAAESIGTGQAAGRLAAGRQADVLVVKGDPVREISALWNVLDVYQAGQRVERGIRYAGPGIRAQKNRLVSGRNRALYTGRTTSR